MIEQDGLEITHLLEASKEMLEAAQKLFEDSCEESQPRNDVESGGAKGEPATSTSNKLAESQGEVQKQLMFDNIWTDMHSRNG